MDLHVDIAAIVPRTIYTPGVIEARIKTDALVTGHDPVEGLLLC
jgi:hypothetical protein